MGSPLAGGAGDADRLGSRRTGRLAGPCANFSRTPLMQQASLATSDAYRSRVRRPWVDPHCVALTVAATVPVENP